MRFLRVFFTVVLWTSFLLSLIGDVLWLLFQGPSEPAVPNATSVTTGSPLTTSLNLRCPSESVTYCLNGGTCYISIDVGVLACLCQNDYGGKRCEKFIVVPLISDSFPPKNLRLAVAIFEMSHLIVDRFCNPIAVTNNPSATSFNFY